MPMNIAVFPGDGVGEEIVPCAIAALEETGRQFGHQFVFQYGRIGGAAIDAEGIPLPDEALQMAYTADAVLLGAVGGPRWESLDYAIRPERALLGLREQLGLYANLRPVKCFKTLSGASTLKPDVIEGIDLIVVRELTGGIYFGKPRGVEGLHGNRRGVNTEVYTESEIARIARVAFDLARRRNKKITSVDKANVLEVSELWRAVVTETHQDYPDVALSHMYVDNCAMQLVRRPKQFDVVLTSNLFGDILSDEAAMLTGSIGMLPSASLGDNRRGLYEPIHGSAPDIAGQDRVNPIAMILSAAMMLEHSFGLTQEAAAIEQAVLSVLDSGARTEDIASSGMETLGTREMGRRIVSALRKIGKI